MPSIIIQLLAAGTIAWLSGLLIIKSKKLRKDIESTWLNGGLAYIVGVKVSLLFTHYNGLQQEWIGILYNWGDTINQAIGILSILGYYAWFILKKSTRKSKHISYLFITTSVFAWIFFMTGVITKPKPSTVLKDLKIVEELETLSGEQLQLREHQVVILNFWATWCPPCRAEMPDLQEFSVNHPDVNFIAVNNIDSEKKGAEGVSAFMTRNHYTFNVLLDAQSQLGNQFGISAFPTTVVVDATGQVLGKKVGVVSKSWLESFLTED